MRRTNIKNFLPLWLLCIFCAVLSFNIAPQPLFHKNFTLLTQTLENYQLQGYTLYILADSQKQQQRLKEIFASEELKRYQIQFTPVDKTLHEGFIDHDKKSCFFTDHQIFDRFHKYNLRSDSARAGKMALTMKELHDAITVSAGAIVCTLA